MKRATILGLLLLAGSLPMAVMAYQNQPERPALPDLEQVKDNLYVIAATNPRPDRSLFTGGAIGVFVTENGVVLVDTKLAGYGPQIIDRVKKVTDKPITTIINTHTHGDHVGSNEAFPASVEIIAHENTKANMAKMPAFAGEKAQFLPDRTFRDKLTLFAGNDQMDLYYFGRGHTGGDTFVHYPALGVLQTGDMYQWHDAPSLDANNGGSGVEFPQTLAKALATVPNFDVVVPGHSPVTNRADLEQYQRFMTDLVAAAESGSRSAQTSEQVAASFANSMASKYAGYKFDLVKGAVDVIYAELNQ